MTKKTDDDFNQLMEDFTDKVDQMVNDLYQKATEQGPHYYEALNYLSKYKQMAYGTSEDWLEFNSKRIFDMVAEMAIHRLYDEAKNEVRRGDSNEDH